MSGSWGNGIVLGNGSNIWVSMSASPGLLQSYNRTTGAQVSQIDFSTVIPSGGIDGIAWTGTPESSDLYVTTWGTSLYMKNTSGQLSTILTGFTNASDIDIDTVTQTLYIAEMGSNLVRIYTDSSTIPTLSEWAVIIFTILILLSGLVMLRKRVLWK